MDKKDLSLALAVYRVTELFPEDEVLIGQLRKTANRIISEITCHHPAEAVCQIKVLLNYLEIARIQQWTKEINFVILIREYNNLLEEIKLDINKQLRPIKAKKEARLNPRQKKILNYIRDKDFVKLGELSKLFPGLTPRTIRNDLSELVKKKIITRQGERKGSFYKFNKGNIGNR